MGHCANDRSDRAGLNAALAKTFDVPRFQSYNRLTTSLAERGTGSIGLAAIRADQIERTIRLRMDLNRSTIITKRPAALLAEAGTIRISKIAVCATLHRLGFVGTRPLRTVETRSMSVFERRLVVAFKSFNNGVPFIVMR